MSDWNDYITDLRRLLHDSSDRFWTLQEKTDYINRGRSRVVRDTGCNRILTTGYLSPGVEVFNFGGVTGVGNIVGGTGYANSFAVTFTGGGGTGAAGTATAKAGIIQSVAMTAQGTGYTSAPVAVFTAGGGTGGSGTAGFIPAAAFDVVNTTIYWGTIRRPLGYRSWTVFNAAFRSIQNFMGPPAVFSVYNNRSIYVAPIPDQTYTVDLDCVCTTVDMVINDTMVDPIPFPFHNPVSFYGAYLAQIKAQKFEVGQYFLGEYNHQAKSALNSVFTRRLP